MSKGLYQKVIEAAGIREKQLENELTEIIKRNNFNVEEVTLEQLREVMAEYLNIVFLEIAEQNSKNF